MKPTAIALLLLGVIIFFAILYSLGMKMQLLIQEEMEVSLSPVALSLTTPYTDNPSVEFSIDVENSVACEEYCLATLRDMSDGEIVFNESVTPGKYVHELPINRRGEGQKVFSYTVNCNNVRSKICITDETDHVQTSLITVDYTLPPEEKMIKEVLETQLTTYFEDLGELDRLFKKQTLLLELLPGPELYAPEYTGELTRALNILDLWEKRNYLELEGTYDLSILVNDFSNHVDFLESRLDRYNEIVALLGIVQSEKFQDAKHFYVDRSEYSIFEDLELSASKIDDSLPDIELIDSFSRSFENDLTFALVIYDQDLESFFDDSYIFWKSHSDAQKVLGRSVQTSTNHSSYSSFCSGVFDYNEKTIVYDDLSYLNRQIIYPFLDPDGLLNNATEIYFESLLQNRPFVLEEIYEKVPRTDNNGTFNLSTITDWNNITLAKKLPYCLGNKSTQSFVSSHSLIDTNISPVVAQTFVLPDNPRECCVFGVCKPCCAQGECLENEPLIFVHGHAISKGNQPERSHTSFANIQHLLESEGYIDAGELTSGGIPPGVWGEMPSPISIRVSYYYLSYYDIGQYQIVTRKSDSIETYAIRLKELIDEVLLRTGKDKADVVAHSMGGLVVRQYIALFGDEKLDNVILIGTPNYGVEGRVKNLCSVVGSSRECTEMKAGSIFLKRLNVESNTFENGHTIIATGCDMNGEDGDGIVLARSVALPFTENHYIEGECTDALNSNLHIRMADPEYYPETYDLIKEIILS